MPRYTDLPARSLARPPASLPALKRSKWLKWLRLGAVCDSLKWSLKWERQHGPNLLNAPRRLWSRQSLKRS